MPRVTPDIEGIFKKYKDKIYRLALSISHNEKDAEDILQNTFLRITKGISKFRSESNLSTWIYRIAYNEALMALRKRYRQFRVSSSLRQMPIKYRMPLLLHNIEEMPLKESAKILDLSLNSLKTRLHRSRLMLKSEISGYLKDKEELKEKKCSLLTGFESFLNFTK